MKSSFWRFIEQKPLYYKEIDHERVHLAYKALEIHIKKPLALHIVGTNGKGSTGRIVASLLHLSGVKVGHFSSPHILKFNERIWIEGEDISNEALEQAHEKLYAILGKAMSEALSYFEYTTLLALVAMENLEVIVLEAGLGGEFDATNVYPKALSVITPIGLDHQAFLGECIEQIARTKMNSIKSAFVLAFQLYDEVYEIAHEISESKGASCYDVRNFKADYPKEYAEVWQITQSLGWSGYLFENSLLALLALKQLALPYQIEDLNRVKLFGRFYKFLPNVTIDVGHNLLAARAITKTLEKNSNEKRLVLIYNTLNDKDYVTILKVFKPYIKRVELIEIETPRALEEHLLIEALEALEIEYGHFHKIDKKSDYLVFGSFYVVESFLNKIK